MWSSCSWARRCGRLATRCGCIQPHHSHFFQRAPDSSSRLFPSCPRALVLPALVGLCSGSAFFSRKAQSQTISCGDSSFLRCCVVRSQEDEYAQFDLSAITHLVGVGWGFHMDDGGNAARRALMAAGHAWSAASPARRYATLARHLITPEDLASRFATSQLIRRFVAAAHALGRVPAMFGFPCAEAKWVTRRVDARLGVYDKRVVKHGELCYPNVGGRQCDHRCVPATRSDQCQDQPDELTHLANHTGNSSTSSRSNTRTSRRGRSTPSRTPSSTTRRTSSTCGTCPRRTTRARCRRSSGGSARSTSSPLLRSSGTTRMGTRRRRLSPHIGGGGRQDRRTGGGAC